MQQMRRLWSAVLVLCAVACGFNTSFDTSHLLIFNRLVGLCNFSPILRRPFSCYENHGTYYCKTWRWQSCISLEFLIYKFTAFQDDKKHREDKTEVTYSAFS